MQRLVLAVVLVNSLGLKVECRSDKIFVGIPAPGTFSIVAYDPETGDLGVGVASRVLAVGAVVPWAEAGVGAIATQALANPSFGPEGIAWLRMGETAEQVVKRLTSADKGARQRQLAIVDAAGRVASYTGTDCLQWCGAKSGKHYTCQGNILASSRVVEAMGAAFEASKGELAERIMASLEAGEKAGGDSRGKQSAAILVVRKGGGWNRMSDRYIDLRVDDHKTPIVELRRMLAIALEQAQSAKAYMFYNAKQYDKATEILAEASRKYPKNAGIRYDLACVQALRGKTKEALRSLEVAVKLDGSLRKLAKSDKDLASLHGESAFKKLVGN